MTPFNLNDYVWVKLTPAGEVIYANHWRHALSGSALTGPQLQRDADGRAEFQLWDLMAIYGSYLYNGAPQVFEKNTIYFP